MTKTIHDVLMDMFGGQEPELVVDTDGTVTGIRITIPVAPGANWLDSVIKQADNVAE